MLAYFPKLGLVFNESPSEIFHLYLGLILAIVTEANFGLDKIVAAAVVASFTNSMQIAMSGYQHRS